MQKKQKAANLGCLFSLIVSIIMGVFGGVYKGSAIWGVGLVLLAFIVMIFCTASGHRWACRGLGGAATYYDNEDHDDWVTCTTTGFVIGLVLLTVLVILLIKIF